MKKIILFTFLMLSAAIAGLGQVAAGNGFAVEKSVVAGGGHASSGQSFSLTGTSGQNSAGNSSSPVFGTHKAGFWTPEQLQPTAAGVSVSGAILTAGGNGIRNARVTLTGTDGSSRTVFTGSFGLYRFLDVPAGQSYVVSVSTGRFTFEIPAMVITVHDELTGVDFVANPL